MADTNTRKLEADIENEIVAFFESKGGLPLKLVLRGQRGFPDRTVLFPFGKVIFVEVKRPGGKHKAQQPIWLKRLCDLGFYAYTCYSLEHAQLLYDAFIKEAD